jgi:hypothetical protein
MMNRNLRQSLLHQRWDATRIIAAGGPRAALLVGSGACLMAAAIAARVRTPADPDALLTDVPV